MVGVKRTVTVTPLALRSEPLPPRETARTRSTLGWAIEIWDLLTTFKSSSDSGCSGSVRVLTMSNTSATDHGSALGTESGAPPRRTWWKKRPAAEDEPQEREDDGGEGREPAEGGGKSSPTVPRSRQIGELWLAKRSRGFAAAAGEDAATSAHTEEMANATEERH